MASSGVQALAKQFNQTAAGIGTAKPSQENATTNKSIDDKKQFTGAPVMEIAAGRANLRPVVAKKPPDGVKPKPPNKKPMVSLQSDAKKPMVILSDAKKSALVPPIAKKTFHIEKQNGHVPPSTLRKPGPAVPVRSIKENKENSEPQNDDNKDENNSNKFNFLREKFAKENALKMGSPSMKMAPANKPILKPKQTEISNKSLQNGLESKEKSVDDQIYTDAFGKRYKMLEMPKVTGPPPLKPTLPAHPDLYDFQVNDAEEEDLYESYDDVAIPGAARPISMIHPMTEEEEGDFPQEEYDDTVSPQQDRAKKSVSLIDEEYYEDFDEMDIKK